MIHTFFTSDLHIGHNNEAIRRGFKDANEHDNALVERWNSMVAQKDIVWVLGDVSLGLKLHTIPTLLNMNGTKHLISGNHDLCHPMYRDSDKHIPRYQEAFKSVQMMARRKVESEDLLLSHFPYNGDHEGIEPRFMQYRLPDMGRWLLHGHTHKPDRRFGREIHVGVDAWNYHPVPWETIVDIIRENKDAP